MSTYDFLMTLGLDETAGVRDVRRAYARKLKLIDQSADAAGFQALREAYETALAWADYREREEAAQVEELPASSTLAASEPALAPAMTMQPAMTASEAEAQAASGAGSDQPLLSPDEQSAQQAFERLMRQVAELAGEGRLGDPQAWHEALLARLGDEELVSIGARTLFEERIAHMLGHGWQPGNEALFPAAVAAFEWDADRRRLAQFGYVGNFLNQAIDERALFDTQPLVTREEQERIARILRRTEPASVDEILANMGELENIDAYFPALLAVVADTGKIGYWREVWEEQGGAYEAAPTGTSTRERLARWFVYLVLLAVAFLALHALYNAGKSPLLPPPQPSIQTLILPPPPPEMLKQHLAPLNYTPRKPGKLSVSYEVFLRDDGVVNATDMIEPSSGDPDFDMAAARAILDAKPFPPDMARVFRVTIAATSEPVQPRPARVERDAAHTALPLPSDEPPMEVSPEPDEE